MRCARRPRPVPAARRRAAQRLAPERLQHPLPQEIPSARPASQALALERRRQAYRAHRSDQTGPSRLFGISPVIRDPRGAHPRQAQPRAWPTRGAARARGAHIAHADRQIERIRCRTLCGERIPHLEKLFSFFEPHTEWINNGKAGVPLELTMRVAISEDQHGFIAHHRVMEKETEDHVAVPMAEQLVARFPTGQRISFDKGFHSRENQRLLAEIVPFPVLPTKGKPSAAQLEQEQAPPVHTPTAAPLRR